MMTISNNNIINQIKIKREVTSIARHIRNHYVIHVPLIIRRRDGESVHNNLDVCRSIVLWCFLTGGSWWSSDCMGLLRPRTKYAILFLWHTYYGIGTWGSFPWFWWIYPQLLLIERWKPLLLLRLRVTSNLTIVSPLAKNIVAIVLATLSIIATWNVIVVVVMTCRGWNIISRG